MSDVNMTPKGLERQRRILESAKDVFLEYGFEKASVAEIMRRSGGSISSLYSLFGNKVGVFRAMIEYVADDVFSEFSDEDFWTDDIESSLTRFATSMICLISADDAVCLSRVVTGVSGKDRDEVNRIFFELGPKRVRNMLTVYFESQQKKGNFDPDFDAYIAAAQFMAMLKEPWYSGIEVGVDQAPEVKQQALAQAVKVFARGATPS